MTCHWPPTQHFCCVYETKIVLILKIVVQMCTNNVLNNGKYENVIKWKYLLTFSGLATWTFV